MKVVSGALGALVLASGIFAAPSDATSSASTASSSVTVSSSLPASTASSSAPSSTPSANSTVSTKKGLSYNTASYTNAFNISWAYNWGAQVNAATGSSPDTGSLNTGVEFTAMLWGSDATNWTTAADAALAAGATHLLGFNEPDNAGESNLTPSAAAALWKTNMEPYAGKAKLVGPAVTNDQGVEWLQEFFGNCTSCTVDAIAMHWYDTAVNLCYFTGYFTDASTTFPNYPIWITEFAGSGTVAEQQSFLSFVLPWMEEQTFVERYAGFGDFSGTYVNVDGSLTDLGTTYATVVEFPSGTNSSCSAAAAA